jgi:hypothetical protein
VLCNWAFGRGAGQHILCLLGALLAGSPAAAAGRCRHTASSSCVEPQPPPPLPPHITQDFIYSYRDGIAAVSASDVTAAAGRHLHPAEQAAVVVADAAEAGPALRAAGFEVRPLQLVDEQ